MTLKQCPGRFLGIIKSNPSVPKSNWLHVVIFPFFSIIVWGVYPLNRWHWGAASFNVRALGVVDGQMYKDRKQLNKVFTIMQPLFARLVRKSLGVDIPFF